MESDAQQRGSNPSAILAALVSKQEKLREELRNIEKQVYELETSYLQDSSQCGNVLKGFEGFLSASKSITNLKRSRKFQPEDRLFSLSSVTSPAVEEHMAGRDDGRMDFRMKGGGIPLNGPGKPKKGGRTAGGGGGPRGDMKRFRPSNETLLDMDDDDDPDAILR